MPDSESPGDFDRSGCGHLGHVESHADRELVLEDQQRLCLANLLGLGCLGEYDLLDADTFRGVDGEHCRNQRRIARCIGLDVEAFWKSHVERGANRRPGRTSDSTSRATFSLDSL